MMLVLFHPVAGETKQTARWQVTSPSLPNRRLLAPPPALAALMGTVLAGVDAGCGAVYTTLCPGRTWAEDADQVRAALTADLQGLLASGQLADWGRSAGGGSDQLPPSKGYRWQWAPADVDVAQVRQVAQDAVGPLAAAHGGAVHVLAVHGSVVQVKLAGACRGCNVSSSTVQDRLATALMAQVPGVDAVEAV